MNSTLNNSMICGACQTELLLGEEHVVCMAVSCSKVYHYACNGRTLSAEEKAIWVCPECVCAVKKGGSNSETPVGTPHNIKNVALRKQPAYRTLETDEVSMSPLLTQENQLLREQITFLSEQLADTLSTMGRYHSALTTCTDKLQVISERLFKLEHLVAHRDQPTEETIPPNSFSKATKLQKPKKGSESKRGPVKDRSQEEKNAVVACPEVFPVDRGPVVDVSPISVTTQEEGSSNVQQFGCCSAKVEQDRTAEEDFVLVQSKKHRRSTSMRGTAGPNVTSLRAVEDLKYIHLWNMVSTADEILAYLQSLDLGGVCTVEELKPKGNYKSYKLGVPAASFKRCMSADLWPDNARIKMWLFRRQSSKHP